MREVTAEELQSVAIQSAEMYYAYLDRNGKGLISYQVAVITQAGNRAYTLELKTPLQKKTQLETLQFRFFGEIHQPPEIRAVSYDRQNRLLTICVVPELRSSFNALKANQLEVCSDMKFLVERVRTWYETHGEEIRYPAAQSEPVEAIFLKEPAPSEQQRNTVREVLAHPLSYVWGAPGTGKTQIVLSSCILSLLEASRKVLLVAPTNHALEQMLDGVLPALTGAGHPLSVVLRFGTPTPGFLTRYPEVCETDAVLARTRELSDLIDSLKDCLEKRKAVVALADSLDASRAECEELEKCCAALQSQIDDLEQEQGQRVSELRKQNEILQTTARKSGGTLAKLKYLLFPGSHAEERDRYEEALKAHEKTDREYSACEGQINALRVELADHRTRIIDCKAESRKREENLAVSLGKEGELFPSPAGSCSAVQYFLSRLIPKIPPEFGDLTARDDQGVESKIRELERQHQELVRRGNISGKSVVAMTVDRYLATYFPMADVFMPDHIFLDEAAYCSLIKGLPLLGLGVPVTMLGDHMQLQPVCEMNRVDLQFQPNGAFWAQSAIHVEDVMEGTVDTVCNRYFGGVDPPFTRLIRFSLTRTYRFGPALANALAGCVYSGDFQSALDREMRITVVNAPWADTKEPRASSAEAFAIRDLCSKLDTEDFVIMAPYRNQVELIGRLLPGLRRKGQIMTIHASQGQEWHTVILSVTDGSRKFLTDSTNLLSRGKNVVNAAVSRARSRLILVCDREKWMYQREQLICRIMEAATE